MQTDTTATLSADEIAMFIRDGFIRIDNAFSKRTAEQARAILWEATGCDPDGAVSLTRTALSTMRLGL